MKYRENVLTRKQVSILIDVYNKLDEFVEITGDMEVDLLLDDMENAFKDIDFDEMELR